MDSIETHSFTSYSRMVMYLLLDILIPFGMSWVSNSSVLFHSFEATILFLSSHLFRHWLFYWTGQMTSMEKRKWLRLWKMRVIVMFQSYCRQRQYIDTAWKIKHWYNMEDVQYPGPNSKFIASNDSKIGIFMLPLIKFIVCNRLYLFGHIEIGLKNCKPKSTDLHFTKCKTRTHTHTRVHRSMAKFHEKKHTICFHSSCIHENVMPLNVTQTKYFLINEKEFDSNKNTNRRISMHR